MTVSRRLLMTAGATLAGAPRAASAVTPRDTLVMGGSIDNLASLDPHSDVGDVMQNVARNVYDGLLTHDPADHGRLVPLLAERYDISADGRTWTFSLRPEARFASGNKVTAADVAGTFRRLVGLGLSSSGRSRSFGYTPATVGEAFAVLDEQTVRVALPQPYARQIAGIFFAYWSHGILDMKLLAERDQGGDQGQTFLKQSSAGSGAFRVAAWRPNEQVALERVDGYWNGRALLRRVLMSHVPEPNAAQLALERGDLDLSYRPPADLLKATAAKPGLKVITGPAWLPTHIAMNVTRKPFDDVRVRQALKHLVNYESIPRLVGAFGLPQQSLLQSHHVGYTGSSPFKLDVQKAKALLAEAGLPNGFACTLRARDNSVIPPVVEEFQQNARLAGVMVRLVYEPGSILFPAWRNRDFDLIAGASGLYSDADDAVSDFMYNPDNADRANNNRRSWRSGWMNERALELVLAGRVEQDQVKRATIYRELEQIFLSEGPFIMLFNDYFAAGARGIAQGLEFRPDVCFSKAWKAG